jgi:small subunit ribosomal protein S18
MQSKPAGSENKGPKKYYSTRKKFCLFCKERVNLIDYKNAKLLENYTSETGKISPARVTGTCAYHQKQLGKAIKRARHMALLKYIEDKRG